MKKIIKIALLAILAVGILVASYIIYEGHGLYTEAMEEQSLSSRIAELESTENYTYVEDISQYFLDAVVAVEDHSFYSHSGVNITSTIRALFSNIINGDLTASGGSTITQQLAKNLCFTQEKKFSRKVAELFVVSDLESDYSKDKILELYVNLCYYGNNCTGIYEAAMGYFGVTPEELTLDQASYLAGLLQAPSTYAADEELALARQEVVLDAMKYYGFNME